MSVKIVNIPNLGQVSIYKRKGTKSMRISVGHEGEVKLSMPRWASYSSGILFINAHTTWIRNHQTNGPTILANNMRVGKAHILVFENSQPTTENKISTRIISNKIVITMSTLKSVNDADVQAAAKKACLRALKKEAEQLLPKRLEILALKYGFDYDSVKIKQLKSRWGSCNNLKVITLSFYLMQLPWELIDYVILHELTHTKVLSHGPKFWNELEKYLPNARSLKKEVNKHKPIIETSQ